MHFDFRRHFNFAFDSPEWQQGLCRYEWCSDGDVLDQLRDLTSFYADYGRILAVSATLLILRLLVYFSDDDRMNVILFTLKGSFQDLFSFVVFLGVMILGFVSCGVALFGTRLDGFRSFGNAFPYVFKMLLGDFDYDALNRVDPWLSAFFFYPYIILQFSIVVSI